MEVGGGNTGGRGLHGRLCLKGVCSFTAIKSDKECLAEDKDPGKASLKRRHRSRDLKEASRARKPWSTGSRQGET